MTGCFVGVDLGSRTVKLVALDGDRTIRAEVRENSFEPINLARELLAGLQCRSIVATGYGRHLFEKQFRCEVISEIKAFALGAKHLFQTCRTILDIGGQDTKIILLDPNGRVLKFDMNDKCAAGTGRFLEIMAMALGFTLHEFAETALASTHSEKINQTCAVFAESEVVSLIARGVDRATIARGLHNSVAGRAAVMLKRLELKNDVIFCGGVAFNPCLKKLLELELGVTLLVPPQPQILGALGAALHARAGYDHENQIRTGLTQAS